MTCIFRQYGAAGSVDDALNRVQSLHDEDALAFIAEWQRSAATAASFHRTPEEETAFRIAKVERRQYLKLAMAAKTTLPQARLQRRWTALDGEDVSDGGDPYTGNETT